MNIQAFGPAYYPSPARFKYMAMSAKRHSIDMHYYGVNKPFENWIHTHIVDCIEELKSMTASHAMFTDTADAIWLRSMPEIENIYNDMHCPPVLIGREKSGLNFGGWLGSRTAMIDVLSVLNILSNSGDPQERLRYAVDEGLVKVTVDEQSRIFQVVDGTWLEFGDGMVTNMETETAPCLLHLAGGFSHPENGKEDRLKPIMQMLGYPV